MVVSLPGRVGSHHPSVGLSGVVVVYLLGWVVFFLPVGFGVVFFTSWVGCFQGCGGGLAGVVVWYGVFSWAGDVDSSWAGWG